MSDEPELTLEQEERVRRLLAGARVEAPMPEDVAARLDRVLAQLAEGEATDPDADVVALASRRRRKVRTLLVAAAAVVAVGVGIGQVLPETSQDDALSSEASESEDAGGGLAAAPETADEDESAADAAPSERPTFAYVDGAPVVRATRFADDVARIAAKGAADATASGGPDRLSSDTRSSLRRVICDRAAWGVGRLQLVRYDGRAAVLAFRPQMGDSQVVDLLQCGTGEVLRSVTLALE